ncbi:TetR/AcrR family transcriptional regulator [Psychromicrobium lacuslunae]|uniref:TetR family transcriptional regulator n=1 Tax=Psychromicrobium lacuslunae TaxID=1618207 RepID=A0A0D4C0Z7_9MICC|nr:WHG domain-containing protein [Psychromicrobium lacuslunae]AJT42011.1 hypothetical protein UM93_11715 [Psychromicrobium lacuslunae]
MGISGPAEQRRRDRESRGLSIAQQARLLAESEGWDGLTVRRLATEIGYSQPVIYSHFPGGKTELMTVIAQQGFVELAEQLEAASHVTAAEAAPVEKPRRVSPDGQDVPVSLETLRAASQAYLGFAASNPATYDAMFTLPIDSVFGEEKTPEPQRRAFNEVARLTADESAAELLWSTLHGLATLERAGRLRENAAAQRLDVLVSKFG